MTSTGKPLDDEEMVSYILAGLNIEYNLVVSAILARVEPISVNELYGQLLGFESRQVLLQGSNVPSANAATHGRGGFTHGRDTGRGRGGGNGERTNNFRQNNNNNRGAHKNSSKHQICQVCEKEGHTVIQCWYRYERAMVQRGRRLLLLPMHMG
jgi:hypothetical protein